MPVVINEFEVVQDSGPGSSAAAPAASTATQANQQGAAPLDVERLLVSRRARELRVRAY